MSWLNNELDTIYRTDDFHISPFREDGITYGTPTWVWSVVWDKTVYVRAYNGPQSTWYQAALKQRTGRILAAGIVKDVYFEQVNGVLLDRIDEAYRVKYRENRYLNSMINLRARSATVRVIPQEPGLKNMEVVWPGKN